MRTAFAFLFVLLALPGTVLAQWRVALLSGSEASHGDARDELDPAHPELHVEAPGTLTVAIARVHAGWRAGIDLHHTSAGVAEVSASAAVVTRDVLTATGAALEVARRVAGTANGPALHVALGLGIDRWVFDLDNGMPRWRASARGALEAELPVSPAWRAVIRGQARIGASVFNPDELPDGFVPRPATRAGISLGIARWW